MPDEDPTQTATPEAEAAVADPNDIKLEEEAGAPVEQEASPEAEAKPDDAGAEQGQEADTEGDAQTVDAWKAELRKLDPERAEQLFGPEPEPEAADDPLAAAQRELEFTKAQVGRDKDHQTAAEEAGLVGTGGRQALQSQIDQYAITQSATVNKNIEDVSGHLQAGTLSEFGKAIQSQTERYTFQSTVGHAFLSMRKAPMDSDAAKHLSDDDRTAISALSWKDAAADQNKAYAALIKPFLEAAQRSAPRARGAAAEAEKTDQDKFLDVLKKLPGTSRRAVADGGTGKATQIKSLADAHLKHAAGDITTAQMRAAKRKFA